MKNFVFKIAVVLFISSSFFSCSSDDSAVSCPEGFTGQYCETKITPSKIFINEIVIRNFPLVTNDLEFWDNGEDNSNEYPDVFLILGSGNDLLLFSDYIVDADENTGHISITPSQPIEIVNVLSQYTIGIFDFDGGENFQEMAYENFNIYKPTDVGFPELITIHKPSQYFIADVYISYQW